MGDNFGKVLSFVLRVFNSMMKFEPVFRTKLSLQGDAVDVSRDCDVLKVARNEAHALLGSAHAEGEVGGGDVWRKGGGTVG